MDNLTNQIITLANDKKYFILRQAMYKSKTYYLGAEVNDEKNDFKKTYAFLERNEKEDGRVFIKEVADKEITQVLAKNIKLED